MRHGYICLQSNFHLKQRMCHSISETNPSLAEKLEMSFSQKVIVNLLDLFPAHEPQFLLILKSFVPQSLMYEKKEAINLEIKKWRKHFVLCYLNMLNRSYTFLKHLRARC